MIADLPFDVAADRAALASYLQQPPYDPSRIEAVSAADEAVIEAQLQRRPRGLLGIANRCPAGHPAVVITAPRVGDQIPFPTTFYLTCPRAVAACSTLEAAGTMSQLTQLVATELELADAYAAAHQAYLDARMAIAGDRFGAVPEIAEVSAGGMPSRVKCLHALLGHTLAAGPGVNPIGDLVFELVVAAGKAGSSRRSFPCQED